MIEILKETARYLVCVKPAGTAAQGTQAEAMPQLLSEQLGCEIFPVHRLDQTVGGVMVYSRRPAVSGKLTGLVSQRQMEKEYLAVLTGHPQSPADTLTDLLFRDAKCNKSYVVSRMRKGVREASLSYEELGRADALSLVCIRLHTGRTHQIRCQFSARGLPLWGDKKYSTLPDDGPIALWSHCLHFAHPDTGEVLYFEQQPPDCYPWDRFTELDD